MATITKFEDVIIWKQSRFVCQKIKELTSKGVFAKDFDLKNQISRSSGSCMDNIAEGFEREGNKEFKNFLSIAKGSIGETRSQLYRALDYNYITQAEFNEVRELCNELSKRIGSFMNYLKNTEYKGNKFEEPLEKYGLIKSQPQTSNLKQETE